MPLVVMTRGIFCDYMAHLGCFETNYKLLRTYSKVGFMEKHYLCSAIQDRAARTGGASAIRASSIAFGLHYLCTIKSLKTVIYGRIIQKE
jgi:hypothetical protein